jgi:hypothetical protein
MNRYLLTVTAFALALSANAQQNAPVTAKDYEHAESFLSYNTDPFIDRSSVRPNWLAGDKFWYRVSTAQGNEFILVDPVKKTRTAAFDSQKLVDALSAAAGKKYDANKLPFQSISYAADGKSVLFTADGKKWSYNPQTNQVTEDTSKPVEVKAPVLTGRAARGGGNEVFSPDGKRAAFIKNYNLWVRDVATNKQTQLTTDGIKDFGYATDNAGWTTSDRPIVSWSPDSKKIATFQQDQRNASDMYLVTTNVGKPKLMAWKYPLPGDKEIITIQRVIVDVDNAKVIRFNIAPDPHRATLSDDISSSGTFDDADWKDDGSEFAFVSTSRDHKNEKFRIANAQTGAVREVFEETVKTQYESGWGAINWRYLPASKEIIWFSERDNWGHLYLYDATTGKVKNQITKGNWVVTKLLKVDEKTRTLYFVAGGREPGNPYFSHLYTRSILMARA